MRKSARFAAVLFSCDAEQGRRTVQFGNIQISGRAVKLAVRERDGHRGSCIRIGCNMGIYFRYYRTVLPTDNTATEWAYFIRGKNRCDSHRTGQARPSKHSRTEFPTWFLLIYVFLLILEISNYFWKFPFTFWKFPINSKNTQITPRTDLSRCAHKITMLDKSLPCNLALMSHTIEKTRNFLSNQTENICHNEKDNGAIAYRSSL